MYVGLVDVELKLKPTSYAGFRNEEFFDNYGGLNLMAGLLR